MYKKIVGLLVSVLAIMLTSCSSTPPVNQKLAAAANSGDLEKVKQIVENESGDVNSVDEKGYSTLQHASNKGYTDIVDYLRSRAVNVKYSDGLQGTSLHHAAYMGHENIVKKLEKDGADLNAQTDKGFTALERASYKGHVEIVKFLIEKGADMTIATNDGDTPLHMAAFAGNLDVVKVLSIQEAYDPNVTEVRGFTPLHYAVYNNHYEVADFLISNGANAGAATNDGITVLQIAQAKKNAQMIALVQKALAN